MDAMINRTHTGTRVHTLTKHPFNKRTAHIKFLMDGDMGRVDVHRAWNVEQIPISSKTDIDLSFSFSLSFSLQAVPYEFQTLQPSLSFAVVSFYSRADYMDRKQNKANNTMPTMIQIPICVSEFSN